MSYSRKNFHLYVSAFVLYALFAFYAFHLFSIPVFILSIALAMFAAWLYGFFGCLITTVLCVPLHFIILRFHSDDPTMWKEALNPFGIGTQLAVSGSIALLKHAKEQVEKLNKHLELMVKERTRELTFLKEYIIKNHETSHTLLSRMLLGDIGDSLEIIQDKCDKLENELKREQNPAAATARKLGEMVRNSMSVIRNMEFVDHYYDGKSTVYTKAVKEITDHFSASAGICFDLNMRIAPDEIPAQIQQQLYRITMEAVTNAVRHANATQIQIDLSSSPGAYHLSIINNGRKMPARIESGLGLNLMRHRVEQLDGDLILQSNSDGRTELACIIPCCTGRL